MDTEQILMGVLDNTISPNLQLPDPRLLSYYKDVTRRMYTIAGDIDEDVLDIVKAIYEHNIEDMGTPVEKRQPICLFIDSRGGDLQIMWSVVNAMKISKTPIRTIVFNEAMSAAGYILAAGHQRFALPGATILVHSGSCQYSGDVEKVESAKKYYDSLSKKANDFLLAHTKISPKEFKKKGTNDWYMTAEEALELGMVDKVITDFAEIVS